MTTGRIGASSPTTVMGNLESKNHDGKSPQPQSHTISNNNKSHLLTPGSSSKPTLQPVSREAENAKILHNELKKLYNELKTNREVKEKATSSAQKIKVNKDIQEKRKQALKNFVDKLRTTLPELFEKEGTLDKILRALGFKEKYRNTILTKLDTFASTEDDKKTEFNTAAKLLGIPELGILKSRRPKPLDKKETSTKPIQKKNLDCLSKLEKEIDKLEKEINDQYEKLKESENGENPFYPAQRTTRAIKIKILIKVIQTIIKKAQAEAKAAEAAKAAKAEAAKTQAAEAAKAAQAEAAKAAKAEAAKAAKAEAAKAAKAEAAKTQAAEAAKTQAAEAAKTQAAEAAKTQAQAAKEILKEANKLYATHKELENTKTELLNALKSELPLKYINKTPYEEGKINKLAIEINKLAIEIIDSHTNIRFFSKNVAYFTDNDSKLNLPKAEEYLKKAKNYLKKLKETSKEFKGALEEATNRLLQAKAKINLNKEIIKAAEAAKAQAEAAKAAKAAEAEAAKAAEAEAAKAAEAEAAKAQEWDTLSNKLSPKSNNCNDNSFVIFHLPKGNKKPKLTKIRRMSFADAFIGASLPGQRRASKKSWKNLRQCLLDKKLINENDPYINHIFQERIDSTKSMRAGAVHEVLQQIKNYQIKINQLKFDVCNIANQLRSENPNNNNSDLDIFSNKELEQRLSEHSNVTQVSFTGAEQQEYQPGTLLLDQTNHTIRYVTHINNEGTYETIDIYPAWPPPLGVWSIPDDYKEKAKEALAIKIIQTLEKEENTFSPKQTLKQMGTDAKRATQFDVININNELIQLNGKEETQNIQTLSEIFEKQDPNFIRLWTSLMHQGTWAILMKLIKPPTKATEDNDSGKLIYKIEFTGDNEATITLRNSGYIKGWMKGTFTSQSIGGGSLSGKRPSELGHFHKKLEIKLTMEANRPKMAVTELEYQQTCFHSVSTTDIKS